MLGTRLPATLPAEGYGSGVRAASLGLVPHMGRRGLIVAAPKLRHQAGSGGQWGQAYPDRASTMGAGEIPYQLPAWCLSPSKMQAALANYLPLTLPGREVMLSS